MKVAFLLLFFLLNFLHAKAQEALMGGRGISEDNTFYAYYPHQITLYEVQLALEN